MSDLGKVLKSGRVLLMDGAMGTELQRLSSPVTDVLATPLVHRSYLEAGADVLLTATFQTNLMALAKAGIAQQHHQLWQTAISSAHVPFNRPYWVLADVGPIEMLTDDVAAAIWEECVGVDGILLETWTSLDDLKRFADARTRSSLPLLVSFTYHRDARGEICTFGNDSPEDCAKAAAASGAIALGANCGKEIAMTDMAEISRRYRAVIDLPTFVKPNAGTPAGTEYARSPRMMAAELPDLLGAGIAMVGGCCGTTPEHIRAFRAVLDDWNR